MNVNINVVYGMSEELQTKQVEKLNEIVGIQARQGKTNSSEMQMLKSIKNKIELLNSDVKVNIFENYVDQENIGS